VGENGGVKVALKQIMKRTHYEDDDDSIFTLPLLVSITTGPYFNFTQHCISISLISVSHFLRLISLHSELRIKEHLIKCKCVVRGFYLWLTVTSWGRRGELFGRF